MSRALCFHVLAETFYRIFRQHSSWSGLHYSITAKGRCTLHLYPRPRPDVLSLSSVNKQADHTGLEPKFRLWHKIFMGILAINFTLQSMESDIIYMNIFSDSRRVVMYAVLAFLWHCFQLFWLIRAIEKAYIVSQLERDFLKNFSLASHLICLYQIISF